MIGMPNINQYFKVAMSYPVARLQAVMRGQDHSIPTVAAMAAFEVKGPLEIAQKAEEAKQKQATVSVRDKLAHEGEEHNGMLPDNAMMAMYQQQQGSLPENSGIGQLPAPNMQTMHAANGGIIAFDDGGYVPGYAGSDLFARSDVDEDEIAALKEDEVGAMRGRGSPPVGGMPEKTRKFLENKDKDKGKTKGRAGVPIKDTNILDELIGKPTPSSNRPSSAAPETPAIPQAEVDKLMQANRNMQTMPREVIPSAPPPEKRTGIAAIPSPQTGGAGGKSDIDRALDISSRLTGGAEQDYKAKLANYGDEAKAVMDKLALEREQGKPTGQAYSGLEAALKKDEEAAAGKEKSNLQMALINAGLAIAGGTSRYALENIGKGAMVGTKQYMEGVDKLEAAAKERQKAMAMIEQERRAEARGDWKDKNEFAAKRAEFELNAKKFGVEGLGKIFELKGRTATELYNNMATNTSREKIAREQNANELQRTSILASAYGANKDPYNVAYDNAVSRMKADVQANPMLALEYQKNPQKQQTDFNNYLRDALAKTVGGGATMPGGGNLKFLGFEKQ